MKIRMKRSTFAVYIAVFFLLVVFLFASLRVMNPNLQSVSPDGRIVVTGTVFESDDEFKNLNGSLRLVISYNKSPLGVSALSDQRIQTNVKVTDETEVKWAEDSIHFFIKSDSESLVKFKVEKTQTVCVEGCEAVIRDPYL